MTKGEETRQAIIEKAAPLFNQRGFQGCTMNDIMKATGLQKGGIYRHFSSKEDLAQAVFRYSADASLKLRTSDLPDTGSPLESIRLLVRRFVEAPSAVPGGCPLLNAAVDSDDGNEALRQLVRESFRKWRKRIANLAQEAVDAEELPPEIDVSWLANTVISTLEGAVMLSGLGKSMRPLVHAEQTLTLVLKCVAQNQGKPVRFPAITGRDDEAGDMFQEMEVS